MKRFEEELESELAREILGSANADGPSTTARERALSAGLSALGGSVSPTPGSKQSAGAPSAPFGSAAKLAAVGGAAIVIGAIAMSLRTPAPAAIEAPPVPTTTSVPSVIEPSVQPVPSMPAVPPSAPAEPSSHVARAPARPKSEDSLSAELRIIDLARAALEKGDARQALAALDAYDRQHKAGVMQLEARVLRVDALVRADRLSDAETLAQAILHSDGGSAYRARLAKLLEVK